MPTRAVGSQITMNYGPNRGRVKHTSPGNLRQPLQRKYKTQFVNIKYTAWKSSCRQLFVILNFFSLLQFEDRISYKISSFKQDGRVRTSRWTDLQNKWSFQELWKYSYMMVKQSNIQRHSDWLVILKKMVF